MKRSFTAPVFILLLYLIVSVTAFPQEEKFSFGKLEILLSPRILENGSFTDFGIGYAYKDNLSAQVRFRYTTTEKNEEISGAADSLNAITENFYEFFLLPIKYNKETPNFKFWAGAGAYYEYNKLMEKGFFDLPVLETLDPPLNRVNSFNNDFRMHLLGPLIEAGLNLSYKYFKLDLYAGVVPIFFLTSKQKTSIIPLLGNPANFSQNTYGSPHAYASLDINIVKYINFMLLYDTALLKYQVIDFDENMNWIHPDRSVFTQSLKLEASLLLPLGSDVSFQVGYGFMKNFISLDSRAAISENNHYLVLSTKKTAR